MNTSGCKDSGTCRSNFQCERPFSGTPCAAPDQDSFPPKSRHLIAYSAHTQPTRIIPFPTSTTITTGSSADDVAPRPITTPDIAHIYHIHVKATRNNTLITLAGRNPRLSDSQNQNQNQKWGTLFFVSSGKLGFKKSQRAGYEAAYQCAIQVFQRVATERKRLELAPMRVNLFFNGFGQGREAVFRALMAGEGAEVRSIVARVTDTTPIKIGGTRSKKRRVL
ncbi:hypothetical protein BS47DRAFT_1333567 [Hydnum rufescens UP504]|uniref:Ribosomal protein S11 n=1 Tax=Hydnum rufescens UP504 TaxID=1448309 RepID=A0A9P6AJM3_9AGAM|nr:hypothetical protein BS47DRAFT_1333567 [Hydnum rufescens UP504]